MKLFVNLLKYLKIGVNKVYYCANERPFVLIVVKSCKWLSFDQKTTNALAYAKIVNECIFTQMNDVWQIKLFRVKDQLFAQIKFYFLIMNSTERCNIFDCFNECKKI